MAIDFRWRIAVFDDHPSLPDVTATISVFTELGLDCAVFGSGNELVEYLGFLRNEKEAWARLKNCHLYLVDLQWETAAREPITLPDLRACDDANRADAGVAALANIFDKRPSNLNAELFLPKPISVPLDVRGFWIAAALSYINPYARILFFSGYEKYMEDPTVQALLQFKTRPVHIMKKHDATSAFKLVEPLFENLALLQQQVFAYSDEAYAWFVSGVVLAELLGFPPVAGECGPVTRSDDPRETWRLTVENFFPQWTRWRDKKETLERVGRFLKAEAFALSPRQQRALVSVRHMLNSSIRLGLRGEVLDRAERAAYQIGQPGTSIVRSIARARKSLAIDDVRACLSLCQQLEANGLVQLWNLCHEFRKDHSSPGSRYECDPDVARKPGSGRTLGCEPLLPFDIEHLRRTCEALVDNAEKHRSVPSERPKVSLCVLDRSRDLVVTYTDNSKGFETLDALRSAVHTSIEEEGLHRGLPLALAFGLHYNLISLEFKLRSGKWWQLFPKKRESSAHDNNGLGVRWTFSHVESTNQKVEV